MLQQGRGWVWITFFLRHVLVHLGVNPLLVAGWCLKSWALRRTKGMLLVYCVQPVGTWQFLRFSLCLLALRGRVRVRRPLKFGSEMY